MQCRTMSTYARPRGKKVAEAAPIPPWRNDLRVDRCSVAMMAVSLHSDS